MQYGPANLEPRRQATTADLVRVYALLEEGSAWLRSRGMAQWNPVYPVERFRRDLDAGCVWLWTLRQVPIATVTLFPAKPDYYPDHLWNDGIAAWYLCRLAVARKRAGQGIGRYLLNELERDAEASGLAALRLDVTATNPFLTTYYEAAGFERSGVGDIKGGASIFLEKRLT